MYGKNMRRGLQTGKKLDPVWLGQFCVRHQYYGGDIPPFILERYAESAGVDNVQVWGYGTSVATLVVAVMGPVLGAVGDHKGMKKKLFTGFLAAGVLFTLMMAVFDQWQLLLAGYVISYIGFARFLPVLRLLPYRRHHRGADGPGFLLGLRYGLHRR